MPGLSPYTENALLEYLDDTLAPTIYLSLHTASPGTTGANETSGGSYARQLVAFGAASGGSMASTAIVTVPVNAGSYTHFGFWDAASSGNFLGGGALSATQTLGSAGSIPFGVGQVTFALTA